MDPEEDEDLEQEFGEDEIMALMVRLRNRLL